MESGEGSSCFRDRELSPLSERPLLPASPQHMLLPRPHFSTISLEGINVFLKPVPYFTKVLDLREMNKAGERLISALSLDRYKHVEKIDLEFARDVYDEHLLLIKSKVIEHVRHLESLNLNGCQKISDKGIEAVAIACPKLRIFYIYWNVRVTDMSIKYLVKHCKHISYLNLSGCKSISDQSLLLIGDNYKELEELNITRCIKITDNGLQNVLRCITLKSLNLYALSSLTDRAYEKIGCLAHLEFLDLCGAQNLSDCGLSSIASCRKLLSLSLTWCVRVTDVGVIKIAEGCRSLQFLSLFGIVGVTDGCLEVLSKYCSNTITTLDVNGCIGIKVLQSSQLMRHIWFWHTKLFLKLETFLSIAVYSGLEVSINDEAERCTGVDEADNIITRNDPACCLGIYF